MLVTADLDQQSNTALHYSVTCAEDVPRVSAADASDKLADLRTKALAQRALAVCSVWPKGKAAADATTPVRSDVPVLILSGGLDPVTPSGEWRGGREDAPGKPAHRRPGLRPHRVAACVRAAAHRGLHRRPDVRDAPGLLRGAFREEPAAAALARPPRGAYLIVVENLAKAFGRQGEVRAVDGIAFTAGRW